MYAIQIWTHPCSSQQSGGYPKLRLSYGDCCGETSSPLSLSSISCCLVPVHRLLAMVVPGPSSSSSSPELLGQ